MISYVLGSILLATIIGLATVGEEGSGRNTKRAEFCTRYEMKDGGSVLRECYEVRKKK